MKESANPLLKDTLSACRGGFAAVTVFSLCINVLMLTVPLFMLQIFDRVLSSRSTDTLFMLMLIAGIALLTLAALDYLRGFALVRVSTWLDRRLGGPVLSGSIVATLRKGTDPSIQGLRDLSTLRTFLTGPAVFPIMDAPWTPIFLVVIFLLHPLLGWFSLGGTLFLFMLALSNELATRKPLQRSGMVSIKSLQQAEAAVRNADVIEAMGMMPQLIHRWHKQNAESLELQALASKRSGGITAFSKFIRLILQIGALSIGAWLVIQNELTPGAMIAGSILMARALTPVEQAIGSWKAMIAARNAYGRLKIHLDEAPSRGHATPLPTPSGRLDVEGVSFFYPGASEPVLRAIGFKLPAGNVLGLVGPTAAGKTTLARLFVGNLVPRTGHVRLDDMDVAQWEPEDLGRHIGYLPQDVELFHGTVGENIARMDKGESEAVIAAAQLAGVHEMVLRMAKGYDTEIGEGGAALSCGQRQRVGLARAVYGDPRFVVLDEPNSNLDGEGEKALLETICTLKERGATTVVIAHRASILQHVDKILVLRNGTAQMFGPRDEVLAKIAGEQTDKPQIGRSVQVNA